MVRNISSIDGVKKVSEIKNFGVRFDIPVHDEYGNDDTVYPLSEKETEEIDKYIEEGTADYDKLMSGDYILVHSNATVKEIFGWSFQVGDQITLHYYDGTQMAEKKVTVLGVLNHQYTIDNDRLEGFFIMPEQAILSFISYDSLNANLLVSTESEKEEAVGEALTQMIEENSEMTLETLADRRTAYEATTNQMFGTISSLAVFIMMFSILSMMNTLITNIVTRKQELAMLESIGMAKGQIRKMLLSESLLLILATVGVTLTVGTLCGYVLSTAIYNTGAFLYGVSVPDRIGRRLCRRTDRCAFVHHAYIHEKFFKGSACGAAQRCGVLMNEYIIRITGEYDIIVLTPQMIKTLIQKSITLIREN